MVEDWKLTNIRKEQFKCQGFWTMTVSLVTSLEVEESMTMLE